MHDVRQERSLVHRNAQGLARFDCGQLLFARHPFKVRLEAAGGAVVIKKQPGG